MVLGIGDVLETFKELIGGVGGYPLEAAGHTGNVPAAAVVRRAVDIGEILVAHVIQFLVVDAVDTHQPDIDIVLVTQQPVEELEPGPGILKGAVGVKDLEVPLSELQQRRCCHRPGY